MALAADLPGASDAAGVVPHGPPGLVMPADLSVGAPVRVRLAAPAPLRRCAQAGCASLGQMARGEHRLLELDRRDGWALVHAASESRIGWLREQDFEKLPEHVAQR